jgi:hypothetical protein
MAFYTANVERMRIDTSGNLLFNSGYGSVATAYGCRAWVSFNGTGTVAIRASGNVSSITDVGTGNYLVNLTTAMPDTNFCVNAFSNENSSGAGSLALKGNSSFTTSTFTILTATPSTIALADSSFVFASVFR